MGYAKMSVDDALKFPMKFGQYNGRSLKEIVEENPGYFGGFMLRIAKLPNDDPDRIKSPRLREAILIVADEYVDEIEEANEQAKKERE